MKSDVGEKNTSLVSQSILILMGLNRHVHDVAEFLLL